MIGAITLLDAVARASLFVLTLGLCPGVLAARDAVSPHRHGVYRGD